MALGTLGSTLNDELNRLANNGTYRTKATMVDEALAAKQWANRENIIPVSTDTVGILNEIAGRGYDKKNWLDFNGVCNYIAGTTGLPAAAALRQVYNTTDLLTSQSAYYVDATAPTNWGSLGYIALPGLNTAYLSVPDANNLDITGDIDIRGYVALDDWTPALSTTIVTKWNSTSGANRGFIFEVQSTGVLNLQLSADGTNQSAAQSTVAVPFTDGQAGWVRATYRQSDRRVQHFTSTDGTTWTQLGTDVTSAQTSIFSNNSAVSIGTFNNGATSQVLSGKFYRAQIFASIDGTDKRLDINIATDYTSASQSTFTATTGQTVTVNGVDTIANLGSAGSLLPTTLGSSTASDSNDPKFLDFTGTNYVYLPGVNGNSLQIPDANDLDITGDIDLRAQIAMDTWNPAAQQTFIGKYSTSGQYSYLLWITNGGNLQLRWSNDGTTQISKSSTVAISFAAGQIGWVRATLDVDNGASGNDVKFYTSTDGTTWTQLGTTVTTAGTTSIYTGTDPVTIGTAISNQYALAGKVYRAQIYNGIDGTKVLDVDTSVITAGSATSFTATTGQTVTINRSTSGRKTVAVTQPTWLFGTDDYMEVNNRYMSSGTYLYLPGVTGNYASSPDANVLDITGDIDIRVKVALDDWTPSAAAALISKATSSTPSEFSYQLNVATGGALSANFSLTGSLILSVTSSAVNTFADGSTNWVRVTRASATGNVDFYTSTDGTTWTALGTTQSTTAGSLYSGTAILEIGSRYVGTSIPARGKFFRAQVLNGIDGTVAFDANFETSITSLNQASFTESSANAATVTINRSGSAYRSAGITQAGYLYSGATNTFTASATDYLNFGATDDFTILAILRQWATPPLFRQYLSKGRSGENAAYKLAANGTNAGIYAQIVDVSNNSQAQSQSFTFGATVAAATVINRTAQTLLPYVNGTAGTSVSTSAVGSLVTSGTLKVGANTDLGGYSDLEFVAAAIFRRALTATQIRQISNYFANREVYL